VIGCYTLEFSSGNVCLTIAKNLGRICGCTQVGGKGGLESSIFLTLQSGIEKQRRQQFEPFVSPQELILKHW